MTNDREFFSTVLAGWKHYQDILVKTLQTLSRDQIEMGVSDDLRSVDLIARHMIGARARWFMDEIGPEFIEFGKWDARDSNSRTSAELIHGLEATWSVMVEAIMNWDQEDWEETFSGEDESEPETYTRRWVIWHLIEHDLHHGGEISIILGANGIPGIGI